MFVPSWNSLKGTLRGLSGASGSGNIMPSDFVVVQSQQAVHVDEYSPAPPLLQTALAVPAVQLGSEEQHVVELYQGSLGTPPPPTPDDNRSQTGTRPPPIARRANGQQGEGDVEAQVNQPRLPELFLMILVQLAVTWLTVLSSATGNHALTRNAKILRDLAAGSNIVGYISFFTTILVCGNRIGLAKRILAVIGYAAASFAFLALVAMVLPDNLNLWVAAIACSACIPALCAALRG